MYKTSIIVVWQCPKYASAIATMCLLNKMPRVLQVPEFPSVSGARVLSVIWSWVPKYLSSAFLVPKCSLSALRVKKVCSITGNGLLNSFIEFFKNFSEYLFYTTLIVFYFLEKIFVVFSVLVKSYSLFRLNKKGCCETSPILEGQKVVGL